MDKVVSYSTKKDGLTITAEERTRLRTKHRCGPGGMFYASQYIEAISDINRPLDALEAAEQQRDTAESYAEKFEGDYYDAMGNYEGVSEALEQAERERDWLAGLLSQMTIDEDSPFCPREVDGCKRLHLVDDPDGEWCDAGEPERVTCWIAAARQAAKEKGE